jgi:hypothetical protein
LPKKITTSVTTGKNEGIHSTKQYKQTCEWLDNHNYTNAQLWHVVLTGTDDREKYEVVLNRLLEKLRDNGVPCSSKSAYELCPTKGFHRHVLILAEAKAHQPIAIINPRKDGPLAKLCSSHGVGFYIAEPTNKMHWTKDGKPKSYMYVPKKPGPVLEDCKNWASYIFKNRTKEGVAAPIYSSSRERTTVGLIAA